MKQEKQAESRFKHEFKPEWIKEGIKNDCISFAQDFGNYLAKNKLTTSQIRNVFGEVKRIQLSGFNNKKTDFHLFKPKIAYSTRRAEDKAKGDQKQAFRDFREILNKAHEAVEPEEANSESRFQNFVDFLEAILAFHKAAGGKDN